MNYKVKPLTTNQMNRLHAELQHAKICAHNGTMLPLTEIDNPGNGVVLQIGDNTYDLFSIIYTAFANHPNWRERTECESFPYMKHFGRVLGSIELVDLINKVSNENHRTFTVEEAANVIYTFWSHGDSEEEAVNLINDLRKHRRGLSEDWNVYFRDVWSRCGRLGAGRKVLEILRDTFDKGVYTPGEVTKS